MLCQITELPEAIQSAMKGFGAELHLQFSKTADLRYFANRCHCGALLGDHYLISEPGEAFFPTDRLGFDAIQVFRLECTGPHVLASDYSIGLADEILKHHLG